MPNKFRQVFKNILNFKHQSLSEVRRNYPCAGSALLHWNFSHLWSNPGFPDFLCVHTLFLQDWTVLCVPCIPSLEYSYKQNT